MSTTMRAVVVGHIEAMVEERRRLGIDRQDERWEGEWHFVNPPKRWHGRLQTDLLRVLADRADGVGLASYGDNLGVWGGEENWRIPDMAFVRPEHETEDGVVGAELVVEVRSPGDETYLKLPFYAERCREVLVVHADRTVELYRRGPDGQPIAVEPVSEVLGVRFETVEGPKLRIAWDGGDAEV